MCHTHRHDRIDVSIIPHVNSTRRACTKGDTEYGYCLNITTKPKKGYKPILVNRKEKKLKIFGEILNGSNVKVKLDAWEKDNTYGHFKGFNLIAVMLLDEVPKLFV